MASNGTEYSIREVAWNSETIEIWSLHDTGRQDDLVPRGVVVTINGGCRHDPFISVNRMAQLCPGTFDIIASRGQSVGKVRIRVNGHITVIVTQILSVGDIGALGGVANLLAHQTDLVGGKLTNRLCHPRGMLEFCHKLVFDVVDDLIAKVLGLFRESTLDKEATENPGKDAVHSIDTGFPSL